MADQAMDNSTVRTVDKDRLYGNSSVDPLIPTDGPIPFEDQFPGASEDQLALLEDLNETCTMTMEELSVPRYNMIQAINIVRKEIEHATAPANGPRPDGLEKLLATRDYGQYPGQTRTAISQIDSLLKDALKNHGHSQQVLRSTIQEYSTTLDYLLDQE